MKIASTQGGCLGALDTTYINVCVPATDLPRYRNRKGQIATNTLAVCDHRLRFVYVLHGWDGSAGDSRILRDALSRPLGFKVPRGQYYLFRIVKALSLHTKELDTI